MYNYYSAYDWWLLQQADIAMGGQSPSEDEEEEYNPEDKFDEEDKN